MLAWSDGGGGLVRERKKSEKGKTKRLKKEKTKEKCGV